MRNRLTVANVEYVALETGRVATQHVVLAETDQLVSAKFGGFPAFSGSEIAVARLVPPRRSGDGNPHSLSWPRGLSTFCNAPTRSGLADLTFFCDSRGAVAASLLQPVHLARRCYATQHVLAEWDQWLRGLGCEGSGEQRCSAERPA